MSPRTRIVSPSFVRHRPRRRPVPLWITPSIHPSIHALRYSRLRARENDTRHRNTDRSVFSSIHPPPSRPSHRARRVAHSCTRVAHRSHLGRVRPDRAPRGLRLGARHAGRSASVTSRRASTIDGAGVSRESRERRGRHRACVCVSTIERFIAMDGWMDGWIERCVLGPYWSVCMPMCDVCIRYEYLVILRVQYRHVYSDIWHFPRVGRSSVVRRVSSRHTRARAFPTLERVGRDSWSGLERERSRASSTRSDSNDSKEGANERTNGRDGVRGGSPRARGRVDEKVRAVNARSARVGSLSSSLSRVDRCESEDARAG